MNSGIYGELSRFKKVKKSSSSKYLTFGVAFEFFSDLSLDSNLTLSSVSEFCK